MLPTLRRNVRRLSWTLWLVIAAFIILYIPDMIGGGAANAVARVDGGSITSEEFRRALNERIAFYRNLNQGELSDEMLRQLQIERTVLEQLIQRRLILAAARDQGLSIAPQEVRDRAMQYPVFRDEDGHWIGDVEYREILTRNAVDVATFEQGLIEDLLVERLTALIADAVEVGDTELEQLYQRQQERVSFEYIQIRPTAFEIEVESDANAARLRSRFEAEPDAYRVAEQRRVSFLIADTEKLRDETVIEEAEARARYEENIVEYTTPEQIKARQILFRVSPGLDDDGKAEVQRAAEAALARLEAGADFGALAEELSDDASGSAGGDLGWVSRGRQVEGFDDAAFALEPGELSAVFETPFGYTIARVDEQRDAEVRPFELERGRIENTMAWERAEGRATSVSEDLRREALGGASLEDLAAAHGLEVQQSDLFTQQAGFGELTSADFTSRVFALGEGRVSEPLRVRVGYVVFRVDQTRAPHTPAFEEVEESVREDVIADLAAERAAEVAAGYARRLTAGEELAVLAAEAATTVENAELATRDGSIPALGRAPQLLLGAFERAAGEAGEPVEVDGRHIVYRVTEHQQPDWSLFSTQSDALREEKLNERRNELFEAYLGELRTRYSVRVYDEVLELASR